eukprot:gnl/Spiro4/17739_TR9442_c0_g1_i1.p2 gnl/Spiro4/17739_TR9442_c0_g1~~gnl/Spiro4/17739_TR9442_c0_g1_i1.p2  ORF type:complete len:142 (-),score=64.40 gnl/Spiro4/17739_TR9442_c0_g1_i1:120-509(-)
MADHEKRERKKPETFEPAAPAPAKRQRKASKKTSKKEPAAKKQRVKKDPNAPKRPKSSYLFFCDDNRARVQAANPALKMTEISKKLGEEWGLLSAKAKEPFEKKNAEAKAKYEKEKAKYEKSGKKPASA